MIKYQFQTKSLISSAVTTPIIDLGHHGFADSFFPKNMRQQASEKIPLRCRLDSESGLIQLENLTLAQDRYNLVDYSYTSSNSTTSKNHWLDFVKSAHSLKKLENARILEIGSNDGYLLASTLNYTNKILGVDASYHMSERANESGIKTINGVFGESSKLIDNIKENYTSFDFIFANNVVNHSNNPIKFISDVSSLLSPKGFFIFEVPYWLDTIKTYRFDQIYHEHITYFTIESAEYLLNQAGLGIHDVSIVSYHGSSLRIFASKKKFDSDHKKNLLQTEKDANLKNLSTYINYSKEIEKIRSKFLYELSEKENKVVFGIGAAAKANTFLTYYGIDYSKMNFILDSSPFKIGKITPVTLIPIVPDSNIKDLRNGLGVVLAWNLKKDLKNRLLSVNTNLEFMDSFDKI